MNLKVLIRVITANSALHCWFGPIPLLMCFPIKNRFLRPAKIHTPKPSFPIFPQFLYSTRNAIMEYRKRSATAKRQKRGKRTGIYELKCFHIGSRIFSYRWILSHRKELYHRQKLINMLFQVHNIEFYCQLLIFSADT